VLKARSQCTPVNLKCEYLINPIGIDAQYPRFTWQLNDNRQGAIQQAWQIVVSTDSVETANGHGNIWKTGRTASSKMPVVYQGVNLQPFTKYFWNVVIPSNSTATLYLDAKKVFEYNKEISDNQGIMVESQSPGNYKLQLASGSYTFIIKNN
jgi:alpha-L-rhamnosidase